METVRSWAINRVWIMVGIMERVWIMVFVTGRGRVWFSGGEIYAHETG